MLCCFRRLCALVRTTGATCKTSSLLRTASAASADTKVAWVEARMAALALRTHSFIQSFIQCGQFAFK